MPRDRVIFLGLFSVAIAGLIADRTVFAPSGAAAGDEVAAAGAPGAVDTLVRAAQEKVRTTVREAMLARIDQGNAAFAGELAFGPDAAWTERITTPDSTNGAPAASAGMSVPESLPKLTIVMPTQSGGLAIIDGINVQVGQTHPSGFKLIAVGDRSATIEADGRTIVLEMPGPGR